MLTDGFVTMLQCPIGGSPLRTPTRNQLAALNQAIVRGDARNACGDRVTTPLAGALVSSDGAWAYGIADGVPTLLPEHGVHLSPDSAAAGQAGPRSRDGASTDERWQALSLAWPGLKPPLRPGADDIATLEPLVTDGPATRPRALLLGVTPEIAGMHWPAGTRLLALDFSEAMIRNVWRRPDHLSAAVARADWTMMPVRDRTCDIVIGDGNLTSLSYPGEYSAFADEIRRVLKDEGKLVLRLFARPERPEPLEEVFADLRAGRIGDASALPWRIAMALHGDLSEGVCAGAVWQAWCRHVPDPKALLGTLGWPPQALRSMEWARGQDYTMRFPTVGEVEALFAETFRLAACRIPDYEAGRTYPTVVLEPKSGTSIGGERSRG